MRKTIFIKNAAVLTASSLILRFAGIIFKVWLAAKIGAEGIGLYQLIFSVFVLAGAFTQSGIPTAVTRLVASESALGSKQGIKAIMSAGILLTLTLSILTSIVLFFGAGPIADYVIGDIRAVLSLKVLSVAISFMGICSVMRGYFIARRKATPTALSGLLEQAVRISAVVLGVKFAWGKGLNIVCAAVFAGDVLAEAVSCLYLFARYKLNEKKFSFGGEIYEKRPLRKIIGISLPLTSGRYLNSLLRTAENMLVPRALHKYSAKGALSLFGMIKGMALPVLFFPSVVLNAVSMLLIPEMSEAREKKLNGVVRLAVEEILSVAAVIGIIFSAVFAAGGYQIGFLLYKSADVGFLLVSLSPIVPLMYLDSLCDGLLKGLDQQKFTFRVSVSDSAIRIVLILLFLERFGIKGFIGIMYFSNLLTCFLNVNRLIKISGAGIDIKKTVIIPVLSAFSATLLIKLFLGIFNCSNLVYIILLGLLSVTIYSLLMFYFKCINLPTLPLRRKPKKYAIATTATSLIK